VDWLVDSGASEGGLSVALVGGQARRDPLDEGRARPGRRDAGRPGLDHLILGRGEMGRQARQVEGRPGPGRRNPLVLDGLGQGHLDRQVLARVGSYLDSGWVGPAGEAAEAAALVEQPDAALARLPWPAADPSARSSSSVGDGTPRLRDRNRG
jgi:hypothetical protein